MRKRGLYRVCDKNTMGSISRLAEKCQQCPNVDICNMKILELCAYINQSITVTGSQEGIKENADINRIINEITNYMDKCHHSERG